MTTLKITSFYIIAIIFNEDKKRLIVCSVRIILLFFLTFNQSFFYLNAQEASEKRGLSMVYSTDNNSVLPKNTYALIVGVSN